MVTVAVALDTLAVLTFKKWLGGAPPRSRKQIVAWTILLLAGFTEILWLVALKNSNGFADTWLGVLSIGISWLSFFMLAYSLKFIPAGTAYAVWTGCGAAGGAIVGMLVFGESRSALRVGSIALIIIGIVGIRVCEQPPIAAD